METIEDKLFNLFQRLDIIPTDEMIAIASEWLTCS